MDYQQYVYKIGYYIHIFTFILQGQFEDNSPAAPLGYFVLLILPVKKMTQPFQSTWMGAFNDRICWTKRSPKLGGPADRHHPLPLPLRGNLLRSAVNAL